MGLGALGLFGWDEEVQASIRWKKPYYLALFLCFFFLCPERQKTCFVFDYGQACPAATARY